MRETLVEKTDKLQPIHQICQTSTIKLLQYIVLLQLIYCYGLMNK